MPLLASLQPEVMLPLGLAVQAICAVGIFLAGRWRALALYALLVPLFWAAPFVLASGHCLACLDGVLYLPVGFLCVVCMRRFAFPPTRSTPPPNDP